MARDEGLATLQGSVMSTKNLSSYDRAPSPELRKLLSPGGFLAPLLAKRQVAGCGLDVHLRPDDKVQVYCGLTSLAVVKLKNDGEIDVSATESYSEQKCAGDLFRAWRTDQPNKFEKTLDAYLDRVTVDRCWIDSEGSVQSLWSRVTKPWIPFDREAVLSYESTTDQEKATKFDQVDEARMRLTAIVESRNWAKLPDKGNEIDQLAVDPEGRLVIVELKSAKRNASASDVYYAPLQLLQYAWEWCSALDAVRYSLQKLLDARMDLGLTPAHAPRITGRGIRAAVGFGDDHRSEEVKRRYAKVRGIVNEHLPPDVPLIETWTLPAQPTRVD